MLLLLGLDRALDAERRDTLPLRGFPLLRDEASVDERLVLILHLRMRTAGNCPICIVAAVLR